MLVSKVWKERAYEQFERAEALEARLDEMRRLVKKIVELDNDILKPVLDLQREAREKGIEPKQIRMPYVYWANISRSLNDYLVGMNPAEYKFNQSRFARKLLGMDVVIHSKNTVEVD